MAEADQEKDGAKGSSKLLIIIIVVLLLIIAGGAGYFFMMGGDDATAEGEVAEEVQEPEEEEPEEDEEEESSSREIYYYELEQALRVNFPKGSAARMIEVRVAFMTEDDDTQEALEKHEPRIVNNALMAISGLGPEQLKTPEGKQQLREKVLEEAGDVMERVLGRNRVKQVFFTAFVMQ